jgi:DNA-binding response OmpR family regulator
MSNVLVVDDEPRVANFLMRFLVAEGHSVASAKDGQSALDHLREHDVDLVLLDLVMPRISGLQVLADMHAESASCPPVIVLSAVTEVSARIQALDRGAVDFVQKPFHAAELVARVRRHLLRAPGACRAGTDRFLIAGDIELDLDRRRARGNGFDVVLTEREFGLLAHLMRRRGDVCSKDELLHDIWGLDFDPGSNVIEVCVRRLRTKLGDPPIETVRGVGYCFYGEAA